MTPLAVIRHAASDWSEARLIQGHSDRPLSPAGRREAAAWRVPAELAGFEWVASPLARARESAQILSGGDAAVEPRLIEMAWGAWEGRRLDALRIELGQAMAENEARGLDFRPPGGESPREVQRRLGPWLAGVDRRGRPTAAVTHRGVIRAILGLATGWDFLGKPPVRPDWSCAQLFVLEADGRPRLVRSNIPLGAP